MIVDELPPAPDPATDSPSEFSAKAAASVLAQKAMVPQINAALGAMSMFAAGGAYAFQYAFDSSTANSDPGTGKLRLSSATQNSATSLRIDNAMSGGADLSQVWSDLLAVTGSVKGALRIVKASDVSKWMVLDITGSTAATGYSNFSVSVRASSAANPFSNGDALMVYVQRAGDVSSGAQIKLAEATITSTVSLINFLEIFRPDCNKYVIECEGITPSASETLFLRLAFGGVVATGSFYFSGPAGSTMTASGGFVVTGSINATTGKGSAITIEIRGVNAAANKTISARGSVGATNGGIAQEGYFSSTAVASGFQLSAGNMTAGTVRVYGILN
jgi:hypothetical protein